MARIIYFHHYNDYSGSTKVLADYLLSLDQSPNTITIITDTSKEGFLSNRGFNLVNVPIVRYKGRAIPLLSQLLWFFIGIYKSVIYGREYETFYINTIIPMYAAITGRMLHKKIVYHIHEKYVAKSVKSMVAEWVFNHTVAERRFVSKYVSEKYTESKDCLNRIEYNKLSKAFVGGVYPVSPDQHNLSTIIMISSLQKGKGIDMFLEVAKKMPVHSFVLIISSSKEIIDDYFKDNVPPNVNIYPSQSDVRPFLEIADVVLNLSQPHLIIETFGMTIIEGMAYGLPAIVPQVGGPAELVENDVNGYCVDVTNADEIVSAILSVLSRSNYIRLYNNSIKKSQFFKY